MILTRLPKVEDMTDSHSAAFITTIVQWALIRVNKIMRFVLIMSHVMN